MALVKRLVKTLYSAFSANITVEVIMISKYIKSSILLVSALFFSSSVLAGSESGLFLGGSIGQATVTAKGQTPDN